MVRPKNRYERRRRNAIAKALRSPALAPRVIPKKTDDDWSYDEYLRDEENNETQDDFRDVGLRRLDDVSTESIDD